MSMFCIMGDHDICAAMGALSIVHVSVDPNAPQSVPCECPCHKAKAKCETCDGHGEVLVGNYLGDRYSKAGFGGTFQPIPCPDCRDDEDRP